jgi:hypothetical protein
MSRKSLGVVAIVLIALMAVVALAGLDSLPRELRNRAQSTVSQVASDRLQFDENRAAVERALAEDPALFRSQAAMWQTQLARAQEKLGQADAHAAKLKEYAAANRREDRSAVAAELDRLNAQRTGPLAESKEIRQEAERWLNYKKNTPELLSELNSRYQTVRGFDIEASTGTARKAMVDWPAKRLDLEARLRALAELKAQGERSWEATADARAKAEAKDYGAVDYQALIGGAETLRNNQQQLQEGAGTVNALAGQLYVNSERLLLDLDDENGKRERVRIVRTTYPDATLQNGQVSQEEKWENVHDARFRELERNVGMVIERKPAGRYDSEAERNAQAPGYAYIAAPGQANQYGSWQNGMWQWLPQYLLLSQLLRGPSYPPVRMDDYYDYDRARRRGETWHGRDGRYSRPWGTYRDRGASSGTLARRALDGLTGRADSAQRSRELSGSGGGFGGSKYQSRGTFAGSRYQSRPSSGFGSRSYSRGFGGRSFGRRR